MRTVFACACVLLFSSLCAAAEVKPLSQWSGLHPDAAVRSLAPKDGFITDAATWEKVWSAWNPDTDLPEIDFTKDFVLVGTAIGPNRVFLRLTLSDSNIDLVAGSTLRGGPGFGYVFVRVGRDGVKTVNGKPLEAKGVQGVLVIPDKVASFAGQQLEIHLWEYDPLLADVGAKQVGAFTKDDYSHEQGTTTETSFAVGGDLEPRADRKYYITVFVLQDGRRTHIGEIDGKNGIGKVLTDGKPSSVRVIARPVR